MVEARGRGALVILDGVADFAPVEAVVLVEAGSSAATTARWRSGAMRVKATKV